jgi:hypothetical protein
MTERHEDRVYKGFRIYFAEYTNGICVDNPQGIRVLTNARNTGQAKRVIRELLKEIK